MPRLNAGPVAEAFVPIVTIFAPPNCYIFGLLVVTFDSVCAPPSFLEYTFFLI